MPMTFMNQFCLSSVELPFLHLSIYRTSGVTAPTQKRVVQNAWQAASSDLRHPCIAPKPHPSTPPSPCLRQPRKCPEDLGRGRGSHPSRRQGRIRRKSAESGTIDRCEHTQPDPVSPFL